MELATRSHIKRAIHQSTKVGVSTMKFSGKRQMAEASHPRSSLELLQQKVAELSTMESRRKRQKPQFTNPRSLR
jgi:hypothetical protein